LAFFFIDFRAFFAPSSCYLIDVALFLDAKPLFVRLFCNLSSSAFDFPCDAAAFSLYFFSMALCLSTPRFITAANLAAFFSAIFALLL
jgi:hypothetical protein